MKSLVTGVLVLFSLSLCSVLPAADFNGDGTGDIAIFRASSSLWAVRGVTRVYFGGTGDEPVPYDYREVGIDAVAIFRPSSGLWAVRGVTRVYFGGTTDEPVPGDYDGNGTGEIAVFRGSSGLWAARGVTRVYFGNSTVVPISPGRARWPGELPMTGQTTSYRTGDDGDYQAGYPWRYELRNFNELLVDHSTGLMWAARGNQEGCNWGQLTDWDSAIDYCNNLDFEGYTDWRLPNIRELQSITDYGSYDPAIVVGWFNNNNSSLYWSSTTVDYNTVWAWCVYLQDGTIMYAGKTGYVYMRAVRGP